MKTNAQILGQRAAKARIPLRALDQVKADLTQARKNECEAGVAQLMLKHGRLTDEARAWVSKEYAQG